MYTENYLFRSKPPKITGYIDKKYNNTKIQVIEMLNMFSLLMTYSHSSVGSYNQD